MNGGRAKWMQILIKGFADEGTAIYSTLKVQSPHHNVGAADNLEEIRTRRPI
jgi:hypothetical protein